MTLSSNFWITRFLLGGRGERCKPMVFIGEPNHYWRMEKEKKRELSMWCILTISHSGGSGRRFGHEFEVNLVYIVNSRPARPT